MDKLWKTKTFDVDESEPVPKVVLFSSKGNYEKMVRTLENTEESVNSTDIHLRSALFYAALNGHKKCLKELLRRGADPNLVSLDGLTPCHAAALGGRVPMINEELSKVHNPLSIARSWMQGLRCLTTYVLHDSQCQKRCLEYLVQYGGDLNISNHQQETPKDIAKRRQRKPIVDMIDEYYELQANRDKSNELFQHVCSNHHWMHSPSLTSTTSLSLDYKQHETVSDRKNMPKDNIVEIIANEITKMSQCCQWSVDGSMWSRGYWKDGVLVTLRQMPDKAKAKEKTVNEQAVMCVELLLREADILRNVRHPNLILLMAMCSGPLQADMFLALEPLQTSSMYTMLHVESRKFSPLEAAGILADITNGVAYLHNVLGLAHCVLSSHAVYLSPNGSAKLCNVFCCQPPATKLPGVCSNALKLFLPWMAPELMQTRITSFESDVYSLGVLLWEVWSGSPPWPGLTPPQLGRVLIQNGQRLPITSQHTLVAPILKACFGPSITRLPAAQLSSQINYLKMAQFYQVY